MRIPVDNRFTDGYIVYYFRISSMLLPRRRNGCRDDAERIALPFQEMDDVRQGVDGRTVAIGIVHEDDQMAMEIGPQLQLLLNVFHLFDER